MAALVAYKLNVSMQPLWLKYRGVDHVPHYPAPQLLQTFCPSPESKNVLLVDDVVVSGKTIQTAKQFLPDRNVMTLVLMGTADIVLFPEIKSCVQWPWNPVNPHTQT